ncbi:MAG: AmmeMemoRadiSam system protein A, partial [Campylobacterota bacterium]|nr:AmmeMemoRadiSam system protein A [Campylobacterota bacterium]
MEIEAIGKLLIDLAKVSIFDKLNNKQTLNKEEFLEKLPTFSKNAATFVTLTIDGNLRGCIGTLVPHSSLYDDITSNAIKAAFDDPRFEPLTIDEFNKMKIEISLISPIVELKYNSFKELREKLIPNKHGVILRIDNKQATFLPQVWEQLPDFDTFIFNLYKKAGLDVEKQTELPT